MTLLWMLPAALLVVVVAWILLGFPFMYIYVQHVLPTLTKHGDRAVWAVRTGEMERQIATYGQICAGEQSGVRRYRYLVFVQKTGRVLGWVMVVVIAGLVWQEWGPK